MTDFLEENMSKRPVVLMVLDGYGLNAQSARKCYRNG